MTAALRKICSRGCCPTREEPTGVGISGVPGAGKSTLIDTMGTRLTGAGHRVGVLAVDPSSMITGGSILGDKTRMARLAADENAFIRPSPSAGTLGGVISATPRVITVLEAAGYDVVLVETMGVGQSEAAVHASVDCLCVLALAGAGDDLQAVKRGLLELADVVAVNKADGDNEQAARLAAVEIRRALPLLAPTSADGPPPVMTVSAATGAGVDELWDTIVEHRRLLDASGGLARRRAPGPPGLDASAVGASPAGAVRVTARPSRTPRRVGAGRRAGPDHPRISRRRTAVPLGARLLGLGSGLRGRLR